MGPNREQVAEPCVEQCKGCKKMVWPDDNLLQKPQDCICYWYLYPASKWRAGRECPGATHLKKEVIPVEKKRVGQKKSKRKSDDN